MKPKFKYQTSFIIFIIACITVILFLNRTHDYRVNKVSRRIIAIDKWVPLPLRRIQNYQWLNDHTIVVKGEDASLIAVDINTGFIVNQLTLSRILRRNPENISKEQKLYRWLISPNGKSILINISNKNNNNLIILKWNGDEHLEYTIPSPEIPVLIWSNTSEYWYGFTTNDKLFTPVIYTIDKAVSKATHIHAHPFALPSAQKRQRYIPTGEIGAHQVLGVNWYTKNDEDIRCRIYQLTNIPVSRDWNIKAPNKAKVQEMAISPEGAKIAWVFHFDSPAFDNIPLINKQPGTNETELWISDLDGSNMKPLAVAEKGHYGIDTISWNPSGQSLYFLYDKYLYQYKLIK